MQPTVRAHGAADLALTQVEQSGNDRHQTPDVGMPFENWFWLHHGKRHGHVILADRAAVAASKAVMVPITRMRIVRQQRRVGITHTARTVRLDQITPVVFAFDFLHGSRYGQPAYTLGRPISLYGPRFRFGGLEDYAYDRITA